MIKRHDHGSASIDSADPRYPIGPFVLADAFTEADRASSIRDLAALPSLLKDSIRGLTPAQIDTPYREGGWTVRH